MKRPLVILFAITFMFVVTGLVCHANDANIINGCYKKNNGQLRIVENSSECLPSEVSILWYGVDEPVQLSEIRINQSSIDYDEYFELSGPSESSLNGLTYIVIGDGAGGSGFIESVVDLTGNNIPSSGFFVAAESTFTLGTPDLVTDLNFENGDNVTHLLVMNFTGSIDDDLDTDDDGVLDVTPWSEMVDCVAPIGPVGSGDLIYCDEVVGPDDIYVPGHTYRCADGWHIGAFDPAGGDDTPGSANSNARGLSETANLCFLPQEKAKPAVRQGRKMVKQKPKTKGGTS